MTEKRLALKNITTILLITLIATTLLWFVLLYESVQEHHRYNELLRLFAEETNWFPFHLSKPYIVRNDVITIMVMGVVLLFSWVLTAREKWREFRASQRI